MQTILLIEDDISLASTTIQYLEQFGFSMLHEEDGREGLAAAIREKPSLILLDLMLPGIDGLEICRSLRQNHETSHIPILMLTARGDEIDRVAGLELGADDYMTKPYSLRELVARIRAIFRRIPSSPEPQSNPAPSAPPPSEEPAASDEIRQLGGLTIDRGMRSVHWQGEAIDLTATEFELLWLLSVRPGQVLSREQILDRMRGREFESFDRSVDVHISKLRKKLEANPKKPSLIRTVWGVGYRLDLSDSD